MVEKDIERKGIVCYIVNQPLLLCHLEASQKE